jgi:hypothetical protein
MFSRVKGGRLIPLEILKISLIFLIAFDDTSLSKETELTIFYKSHGI